MLGAASAPPPPTAAHGGEEPSSASNDVIARSVELGYRVVDEYMTQGRRAAERLAARPFAPAALAGDAQELGARVVRYASDFVGAWVQLMEATVAAGTQPPGTPASPASVPPAATVAAGNGASNSPHVATSASVRVEVASLWPTEVWIDLRPEVAHAAVVVQALRAVDPAVPRLDDVAFTNGGNDPPLFRVRIPPSQPAGVYNGLLIDRETSRPVGTVSVRVTRE
jgi:hypothetical protein